MKGQVSVLAIILIIVIIGFSSFSGYLYIGNTILRNRVQALSRDKNILEMQVENLTREKEFFQKKYSELNMSYRDLNITYHSILSSYYQVLSEYNSLNTSYTDLEVKYSVLQTKYDALSDNYSEILDTYSKLQQEYSHLLSEYKDLEGELQQLKKVKRVAIIVNKSVAPEIENNLNQYIKDIESLYSVKIIEYEGRWRDCLQLRRFLQNLYSNFGIKGAILVGILPYALWEYFPGDIGPLPYYYEDMDGTFEDEDADGIFDHYVQGENEGPEIWVAWMRPDSENVSVSLNHYLEKCHRYYQGNISYQNKALVVVTKDWGDEASELGLSLEKIYPNVTLVGGSSIEVTAGQYLSEYSNWYELTDVWSHGDSDDQEFDQETSLFSEEIKSLDGGSKLTLIWACHAADFHKSPNNNIAISYVFGNNFGLAVIASTRSIGIENHQMIWQSLNEGNILGNAFLNWVIFMYNKNFIKNRFPKEDVNRFMWGFILIGDPFILLNKYQIYIS